MKFFTKFAIAAGTSFGLTYALYKLAKLDERNEIEDSKDRKSTRELEREIKKKRNK